jgi:hypothetical protein
MIKQPEPALLFLSYAHEDESLRKELEKHLSLLQWQGHIRPWHDRQITPGTNWAKEVDRHLENASIILLLISSDFLASDYCYGVEMRRALQLHRAGKARVIPIFLRPVDWQKAPFSDLQGLPRNGRAVTEWPNHDMAFRDIAQSLRQIIEGSPLSAPIVTPPLTSPPAFSPTNGNTQKGTSRRVAVIGLMGLIGIGIGALGLSFYHPSSSPASPTTPITPTSPTSNTTSSTNTTPTSSANTPSPVSDTPTTSTTVATTYSGTLTSQTVNQQSTMHLVITSQDQQGGTIEGILKVDAPLADRSGSFNGRIDSNGNITELIVSSTVSPALDFKVTTHQGNAYSGTYDGTTTDPDHDYLESGIWQMTHS